jgi:hypothetical protein
MARTYRQSRLRATSAMVPGSDIPAAMSGFDPFPSGMPPGPDVAGATGIRRVLTRRRHYFSPDFEHLARTATMGRLSRSCSLLARGFYHCEAY